MANASVASEVGTLGISRWWRVVGGVSMNLALGSLYAWSVFVAPLEKEFKWKRAETSMVFTIAVVVFALTFIVAGRLQDKLGPFKISLVGAVLVSLGFFFCSYADSLTKFFIFFGVLGGLGNGFGYATPIPVMSKWFPDKRGLAVGLAVGGYGGGSAIFGPLAASYLIPHFGWRTTFQVLGVIFFAMTAFGAFLLKNPPLATSRLAGYRHRLLRLRLPPMTSPPARCCAHRRSTCCGWRTPLAARPDSWSSASWFHSLRAWAYPASPWLHLAWWWARPETPWAASCRDGCRTTSGGSTSYA